MANYLDGMDGGKHDSDNIEATSYELLKRQEAIDKLVDDDIDSIITGHQDGDNSYVAALLEHGHKGYKEYTNEQLTSEMNERFDSLIKVIGDDDEYEIKAFWFGRGVLAGRENRINELKPKKY